MKKFKTFSIFTSAGLTLREYKDKYVEIIDECKYGIYEENNPETIISKIEKGKDMLIIIDY